MKKKSLGHLTASQKDLLIAEFFRTENLTELEAAIADGLPLTAYILFMMRAHEYPDERIKSLISKAVEVDESAKEWVSEHFNIQTVYELYDSRPELAVADFPTNEDCVRLKLWNVLLERQQFDLLAQNVPEILEQKKSYRALVALVTYDFEKYAPLALEQHYPGALLSVTDGWKYLIDHGLIKWLLARMNSCDSWFPRERIVTYCLEKGYVDALYEAKFYADLLEHQQFEVFVKNHSFDPVFLDTYSKYVDWEDLWQHAESKSNKKYLLEKAFKNRCEQKNYDFLWNHSSLWMRLWLLSGM